MIDAAVERELRTFKEFWKPYLSVSPLLELDESWLSVAVIDALTYPLRTKVQLSKFEKGLLRGCSAYLAILGARCWEEIGAEPIVEFRDTGIVLRAVSGPGLSNDDEVIVHVERDLGALLEELPRPMQIFSRHTRQISDVENFVSPFAFSIFVGLIPTLEGPWNVETTESFAPQIDKVVRHLAKTCAASYERVYPEETIGQVPELYLRGLIYPLTLMTEAMPAEEAVRGALDFADEFRIAPKALLRLGKNLIRLGDDRIAMTGATICVALESDVPGPEIRAAAHTLSGSLGLLRRSVFEIRERSKLSGEWLEKAVYDPADEAQIKRESLLRFIPWLKLGQARLLSSAGDSELQLFLKSCCDFNLKQALLVLDQLIELTPDDIPLRLQRVYFELVSGEVAAAQSALKTLLTEPGSDSEPLVYDLMAGVQLILGQVDAAGQYFRRAYSFAVSDPLQRAELANNTAWFRLLTGDFPGALEAIEDALKHDPDSFPALLNKTTILHQVGRHEEAERIDRRLIELAAFNRQVFRGLVFDLAEPGEGEGGK